MSCAQAGTRAFKRKSCPKPDNDEGADEDRPSRAETMDATSGDRCSSGAAKRAVKTTPDYDLIQIVERLRKSKGDFTEQTNQDCAELTRRADQLGGTLHTCKSLSGELCPAGCVLLSLEHFFVRRITIHRLLACSRALSHKGYTEEPWFVRGKAQVFFHNPSKRRLRTGSSWVNGSKAVIMLLPHRFTGDEQSQRRTDRTERHGLHFGGRGVHMGNVFVIHGSDVNSGFKARKYQLLEHAVTPASSSAERPECNKKRSARRGDEVSSFGAAAEQYPTLDDHFETGTSVIRHITRSEANSMQVIRQALSRFDDRKKLELLQKLRSELMAEIGDAIASSP